jgi:DNA repair proteins
MASKKGGQVSRNGLKQNGRENDLLTQGPQTLTNAQLLAILLRVGRHGSSAVQVGMDVLDRLGGVAGLAQCGIGELCAVPGVGEAKAAQLKAALELGKRALAGPLTKGTKITSAVTSLPIIIRPCETCVTKSSKSFYWMPSMPSCVT